MTIDSIYQFLGLVVVASPAVLLAVLGLPMLLGWQVGESTQGHFTKAAVLTGLTAAVGILGMMLAFDDRHVPIELGNWVCIPESHDVALPDVSDSSQATELPETESAEHNLHVEPFHFHVKFVFDRLSVPFAILSFVLCGTVGAFASVYLHREPGYRRFFLFYAVFLLGMTVSSLAGTIETLFLGWELVGLSSALLIAYFHERPGPVRNGHRVWTVYRVADAAFLIAALTLHHLTGAGDFDGLMGTGAWPDGIAAVTSTEALLVGLLLLLAAAGKSGMVPFSGWLPRAMEGPTPSSAVFYGALSVHLGTYLLLRVSPLLEVSLPLSIAVVALGLVSAVFGALASRVQTDVKNALAFASLTQVGIITVEIGLGFRYLALVHMIGHACLRTLQLLRAPSVLKDFQSIENAIGEHLSSGPTFWERILSDRQRAWLYRFSSDRGHLDGFLNELVVRPFIAVFQWCDRQERRWTSFLAGGEERESDHVAVYGDSLEDVN